MLDSFWYVATPYSKYPTGLDAAWRAACEQTVILFRAGIPAFSPIVHTHPIALAGNFDPLDLDLWLRVDRPMMAAAHGLIMCRLPSWQESSGMEHERRFFAERGLPVYYMDPGVVPAALYRDPRQVDYEANRKSWRDSIPVAT